MREAIVHPIPPAALVQHVAVLGKTGSGKTYAAKGVVEGLLRAGRRVCVLDPTGAWWGLRSSADGRGDGFPVVVFGGDHADVPITEHAGAALGELIAGGNIPAIIDLSDTTLGERHRFVERFAEALFRANRTSLHLIIDEADEFAPQSGPPGTERMLGAIDRIVRRGRIKGFRVMLISQRPAVLNKNVLTQANTLVAMRLPSAQDRKAIEAWIRGQADEALADKLMSSLAGLARGEGWVWAPEQNHLVRAVFPAITTFDSSRTPEDGSSPLRPDRLAPVDLRAIRESLAEAVREAAEHDPELLRARIRELEAAASTSAPREAEAKIRQLESLVHTLTAQARSRESLIEEIARIVGARPSPVLLAELPSNGVPEPASAPKNRKASVQGPHQRILDAVAWWNALDVDAPSRVQVAMVSGYSASGGTFKTYLSRLVTDGLVEYAGPAVRLTPHGSSIATRPAARPDRDELHSRVLAVLAGPHQRLLDVLLKEDGRKIGRDELAIRTGYSASGGTFKTYLSRLVSLGLVRYVGRSGVAAAEFMFPDSARRVYGAA